MFNCSLKSLHFHLIVAIILFAVCRRCDGSIDCGDNFDENVDCAPRDCINDKEFKCVNGRCIKNELRCDGNDDCGDGSDEQCTHFDFSKMSLFNVATDRSCAPTEFRCDTGGCISLTFHCDHETDCNDGSDERDCDLIPLDHITCPSAQHRCRNGRCIPEAYHCDGENDCGDWSDEAKCEKKVECRSTEYRCSDGQCINLDWKCDGDSDCDDKSDETDCPTKTCSTEEFRCRTGRCVRATWKCDGDIDCSDNSDEEGCGSELECTTGNFRCSDGACINQNYVCDGAPHCADGSDEDTNGTCANGVPCKEDGFPCQHICIATVNGHHCACKDGYQIGYDSRSCMDIDECFMNEQMCSQKCENSVPGYQCYCAKGYLMLTDKRHCKALETQPIILFANRIDIRRVSLDNSEYLSVLSNLQNAIAIDYHFKLDLIFWSDITTDAIYRASFNGSDIIPIVSTGLISPGGITVDWVCNRIFWTDSGTSRIEFANLDGSRRKVLFWKAIEKPRAIVSNPEDSTIFWTDWGQQPRIEKSLMDGSGRSVVIDTSLFWPNGLTIDHPSQKIYWVDAKHHVIECSNLDGSNRRRVIEGDLPHPFAVTIFEDSLYWSDWNTKSIYSASKLTGKNITVVHNKLHFPMDITILHPLRQPDVMNRCDGHKCSHICLPNNVSYICTCPTGFKLNADRNTCRDNPDTSLLFTRRNDIRFICIECSDDSNIDIVLPLKDINSAVSIDYDVQTSTVFWSDVANKTINRGVWNGSHQSVIISGSLEFPSAIAVDWLARNLYWVDASRNVIEVSLLDGTKRSTVMWQSLDQPRDIAVDPQSALMFWSQWDNSNSKIERSGMDGSQRIVLHSYNLTWPHGLTIDSLNKKLYWSDAGMKHIEFSDFNGSGRQVLISRNIKHPYGLVVYGDYVYWTDIELKFIQRAHKLNGNHRKTLLAGFDNLMDIQIFNNKNSILSNDIKNPCLNSGCSDLCLLSPSKPGYYCHCPTGIKMLADNKTCAKDMEKYLIVATRNSIRRISLQVPYYSDVVIPFNRPLSNAIIIDVHINNNIVYWSDTKDHIIYRSRINDGKVQQIIDVGLVDVNGLAIDNFGNKIYWTDAGRKKIEVSNLDGTHRRVLIWQDLDSPRAIALDYLSGHMIWSDWGAQVRIERSDMDGERRAVIVSDNLGWPNGITVTNGGRVVWADSQMHTIEIVDINGANRRQLANDLPSPYGVAIIDDYVYWTDWETRSIHRVHVFNNKLRSDVILSGLNNLVDIRAIDVSSKNLVISHNMCQINNGGCSHLCLRNSAKGYSCVCPTGMILHNDEKTCNSNLTKMILIACKESLRRVSLDTEDFSDVYLPITGVNNTISVDYDFDDGKLYYSDVVLKVIRSVNFDGTNARTVISKNLHTPNGIAVDWVAKNLYWSDSSRNVIEVSRVDGSSRKMIIDLDLDDPRAIAVFPEIGYLFWGDSGNVPKIERAYLDGSNRRVIIATDLGLPNGVAVDYDDHRIFWADSQLDRIESADLEGKHRTILIKDIAHPYGISIFDEYVYWSDWQTKAIERSNKITGGDHEILCDNIEYLNEIKIVAQTRQSGVNPCSVHNGACSHLCLFRHQGYICACPSYPDSRPCSTVPGELSFDVSSVKPIAENENKHTLLTDDKNLLLTDDPSKHFNISANCNGQQNTSHCDSSTRFTFFDDHDLVRATYIAILISCVLIIFVLTVIAYIVCKRRKSYASQSRARDDAKRSNNSTQYSNRSYSSTTNDQKDANVIKAFSIMSPNSSHIQNIHLFSDTKHPYDQYMPPPPPPPPLPSLLLSAADRYQTDLFNSSYQSQDWQRLNTHLSSPIPLIRNHSHNSIETDI